MNVAIENDHAPDQSLGLHGPGRDGAIIEDAITLALVGEGMVRPPGQVDGMAIPQGRPARFERRSRGPQRSLHHFRRPGKTDTADLRRRQFALLHAAAIRGCVSPFDLFVRGRVRYTQVTGAGEARSHDPFAQQRILPHRESMAIGQGKHKLVGVEKFHDPGRSSTKREPCCLPGVGNRKVCHGRRLHSIIGPAGRRRIEPGSRWGQWPAGWPGAGGGAGHFFQAGSQDGLEFDKGAQTGDLIEVNADVVPERDLTTLRTTRALPGPRPGRL